MRCGARNTMRATYLCNLCVPSSPPRIPTHRNARCSDGAGSPSPSPRRQESPLRQAFFFTNPIRREYVYCTGKSTFPSYVDDGGLTSARLLPLRRTALRCTAPYRTPAVIREEERRPHAAEISSPTMRDVVMSVQSIAGRGVTRWGGAK